MRQDFKMAQAHDALYINPFLVGNFGASQSLAITCFFSKFCIYLLPVSLGEELVQPFCSAMPRHLQAEKFESGSFRVDRVGGRNSEMIINHQ